MGWSGHGPASPAREAGGGTKSSGARHVSEIQQRNRRDRHRYRQELVPPCRPAVEAQYGPGSVWWDHALESWGEYEIQIRNALNEARAVVVIWAMTAGQSNWVKSEAGRADPDSLDPLELAVLDG